MKIKGFTLIELLAVIVILAIIALIAVPIILNIIGNSKKSAVVRSGELYLKAVETAIARKNLNDQFNPTECIIQNDGNIICGETTLEIEVTGSKPIDGTIKLEDGKITEVIEMILDGYKLEKKPYDRLKIQGTVGMPDEEISCNVKSSLSVPELYGGLIPVIYSNNNWIVVNQTSTWYNYDNQEWANAIVLKPGVTKNIGDIVDVDNEVQGMFVWIPRYEYNYEGITNYAGGTAEQPGEIKVNFISKSQKKASCDEYKIHPAFTFGGIELSGIWVAKFETSTEKSSVCYTNTNDTNCNNENQTPYVLPNTRALRHQGMNNQFLTAQKFNTYLSNADSHMAKSDEWGAVAYLSQSKYGKYGNSNYVGMDKEVAINNCSDYITGIGGDTVNASASLTTCTTNTYETLKGQAASTTGNITGIYDMNGGAWEYIMGVYNNIISDSGFTILPDLKYYNYYETENLVTACDGDICYGQALSETQGWYNDDSGFLNTTNPWIAYGGGNADGNKSGIFTFYNHTGIPFVWTTFRIIITAQ